MPESELHRRARGLLQRGDRVGQPFGEALVVVGTEEGGNVLIEDGPAKGRVFDALVEAPEGYLVGVEFHYQSKVSEEKIALLKEDGRYPVLEVDLLERLGGATDDELRQYIAGCQNCNRFNRGWLYLPSVVDFCPQFAPGRREAWEWTDKHVGRDERGMSREEIEELAAQNERYTKIPDDTTPFGRLRCCVPGCKGQVTGGAATDNPYPTLPRFACSDHMGHPGFLTHPEGVRAFADSFPGHVADVVQGQQREFDVEHSC